MKTEHAIYGLLAVSVIGLVYAVWSFADYDDAQIQDSSVNTGFLTITSGNTDNGNVEIALTPKVIVNGKLAVDITANTHSVPLDQYDLKKLTLLISNGKQYNPISAPKLNGHHTSGEILFDLDEMPNNFKITIKGIPSVEERIFEWS